MHLNTKMERRDPCGAQHPDRARNLMNSCGAETGRLRVAHISLGLDVGGQERLLVEFARHARRDRFDLTFVSLTDRGKLAETIESCGWPVLTMNESPGLRPGMSWRLARLFRKQKFDVVHTHDDRPLLYAAPAAKLARVKRLIHTHHHGFLPGISRRQMLMIGLSARFANTLACVSCDSACFLKSHGIGAGKLITVWNGIDLERYPYRGPRPGGPAVTVARLSPEKDVANLLRAVAIVAPSIPEFRLDVAGDGPCREELMVLTRELRLNDRVQFLGEVRDVAELLGQASMFVLPSQTEGISLTILEAMARGLPVLATNVGGNPEVVLNGQTGLLAPPHDPAALADGMLQLWGDAELGNRMGRAGRSRVEAHFDIRRMVADYETLYQGQPLTAQAGELATVTEQELSVSAGAASGIR
jgi:glycosyltransferase involved in cell wall biosynthesis